MNDRFQLIVSTDGETSFSTWIFNNPPVLTSLIYSTRNVRIGFDGSLFTAQFANVGEFLKANDMQLPPVSVYRIDGNS